jgi:hypothetical protein
VRDGDRPRLAGVSQEGKAYHGLAELKQQLKGRRVVIRPAEIEDLVVK